MYSPWGDIQHSDVFEAGVAAVSTASHGGIRVSKRYAEKHLSAAAIREAIDYAGYYWFEEDCDWAVPAFELPHLWDAFFKYSKLETADERRKSLTDTLIYWVTGYAVAKGLVYDGAHFYCHGTHVLFGRSTLEKDGEFWACSVCGKVVS